MAIVKMKHLRVMAMQNDKATLLRKLQHIGCVEIDDPSDEWTTSEWSGVTRGDGQALSKAHERHTTAQHALDTLKKYAPKKGGMFSNRPEITEQQLFDEAAGQAAMEVAQTINELERSINMLYANKGKIETQTLALTPWQKADIPLETTQSGQLAVVFATIPANVPFAEAEGAALAESELLQMTCVSQDKDLQYILMLCHQAVFEAVQEALKDFGWAKANLREWKGTAAENLIRLKQELTENGAAVQKNIDEVIALSDWQDRLELLFDRTAQEINREENCARLIETGETFFFEGWVPAERWSDVQSLFAQYLCAWEIRDPNEDEIPKVPVKLKNSPLVRPMNMITEMYSLPAYNGVDPNPLMAPFFILFYGIMMADMGYGLVMMLGALFVLKKVKPKKDKGMYQLFALIGLSGISTFVVGIFTAGFFGDMLAQLLVMINPESTFTWFWEPLFTPLDDTIMILIGSIILGVVHIISGMVIDFIKKTKDGQLMDAIWDDATWWIILVGAAMAILGVGTVAGMPLVLIVGGVMLFIGSGRNAKGLGKITSFFGAVYNGVSGFFSDFLSYSRLMALMLAGSVIAQVFNTLGGITGNVVTFFIISLVGNTLNFGLNILGCFVHNLRLQCLEFFGRFYVDGGRPFRPLEIDTKFVDITE